MPARLRTAWRRKEAMCEVSSRTLWLQARERAPKSPKRKRCTPRFVPQYELVWVPAPVPACVTGSVPAPYPAPAPPRVWRWRLLASLLPFELLLSSRSVLPPAEALLLPAFTPAFIDAAVVFGVLLFATSPALL